MSEKDRRSSSSVLRGSSGSDAEVDYRAMKAPYTNAPVGHKLRRPRSSSVEPTAEFKVADERRGVHTSG